jgi:hypothetical protein
LAKNNHTLQIHAWFFGEAKLFAVETNCHHKIILEILYKFFSKPSYCGVNPHFEVVFTIITFIHVKSIYFLLNLLYFKLINSLFIVVLLLLRLLFDHACPERLCCTIAENNNDFSFSFFVKFKEFTEIFSHYKNTEN